MGSIGTRSRPRARMRLVAAAAAVGLVGSGMVAASVAQAAADGLPGSNFEIETDANLTLDSSANIDWLDASKLATPDSVVQADLATGQNDDSYSGGVKEDTSCPSAGTGSIPNNKSDLRTFRVYVEAGSNGHPGYLNLAWSRVADPSGTTLMDFEFNQSSTGCSNGPNKQRTPGDLLIEYAIDQGGQRALVTKREWSGTVWGAAESLSTVSAICGGEACAVGTINTSPIAAADSGINSALSARTFGEATIDLRTIFDSGKCESFGSAMLKSRSSDSFTSQLKDYIAPKGISLTNCGKVIIRKVTNPDGAAGSFSFSKAFTTDPATSSTFNLSDKGVQEFNNVLLASNLTVEETNLPTGFTLVGIDCGASTDVTPVIDLANKRVTFAIDSTRDILDCTYTNEAKAKFTVKKVVDPSTSTQSFGFTPGSGLPSGNFSLTHNGTQVYSDLAPGSVSVTEGSLVGWDLTSISCVNAAGQAVTNSGTGATATVSLAAGSDVTCTYNNRQRATIVIVKKDDAGAPLVGAGFTATASGQPDATCTTALVDHDSNPTTPERAQCTLLNVVPGVLYTVTETTVPTGYQAAAPQTVTPGAGARVELTFIDNRLFKVITFVCQESDNSLYGASANFGSSKSTQSTVPSVAGADPAELEAALCGLDANFGGLPTGTYNGSVTIP